MTVPQEFRKSEHGCSAPSKLAGSSGFTLIELMICIVIVGVLTTIAIPTMRSWTKSNELNSEVGVITSMLDQARSTAVERGKPVYMRGCSTVSDYTSALGGSEPAACGKDWSKGIYSFIDADMNTKYQPTVDNTASKDEIISTLNPDKDATITIGGTDVIFLPNGLSGYSDDDIHRYIAEGKSSVVITFCAKNGSDYFVRTITLSTSGSVDVATTDYTNQC